MTSVVPITVDKIWYLNITAFKISIIENFGVFFRLLNSACTRRNISFNVSEI